MLLRAILVLYACNRPFARSDHMVQNHNMLVSKLHSRTNPKQRQVKVDWYVALFWKSYGNFPTSMCDFVPCDRIMQRAYFLLYCNNNNNNNNSNNNNNNNNNNFFQRIIIIKTLLKFHNNYLQRLKRLKEQSRV